MSEIAALTNSGTDTVVPGYILSRPRIEEIGMAEVEFARRYIAMMSGSLAAMPPKIAEAVMLDAKNDILLAKFGYGGPIFNMWAMERSSLPYLTWLCLRVKHDKVTLEQVAAWYGGAAIDKDGKYADPELLATTTWELFGYGAAKKNAIQEPPSSPPTGSESSTDAAPQAPPASDSAPSSSST